MSVPSTLTNTFGTLHATTDYGFLYMVQGIGSTSVIATVLLKHLRSLSAPACAARA